MPAMNAGGDVVPNPPAIPAVVANPSIGSAVIMSPFSGPKGSAFDAMKYPSNGANYTTVKVADTSNTSTGAMSTGIGFGPNASGQASVYDKNVPASVNSFMDDYTPGMTMPAGTAAADGRLLSIGGGKSVATPVKTGDYSNTLSVTTPYSAAPILAFGNGGSRDAGAGPVFTGFAEKVVTNPAGTVIANGSVIETGFVNRTGGNLLGNQSAFGSATAASTAPS